MTTLVNNPSITLQKLQTPQPVLNATQRVLMVAQTLPAGVAPSGELVPNIQLGQEDLLFGVGSHAAALVRAFKNVNIQSQLDVIPLLEDVAGTQFDIDLTFVGTTTRAGTLQLIVGSAFESTYTTDVIIGATENDIAVAFETLINNDLNAWVTASVALGVLSLTATAKGTIGNQIGVKFIENFVEGVVGTLGAPTGGTGDPALTGIFDVVGNTRYQTVVYPTTYLLTELTNFLGPRFNVVNNILDGVGLITKTDTFANIVSLTSPLNDQNLVVEANQLIDATSYRGGDVLEMADVLSTLVGAVRSLRLTQDAPLADILPAVNAPLDQRGGTALSSLPYFNTALPRTLPGDTANGFIDQEQIDLINAGASLIGVNRAQNAVLLGTTVTTRKTDGLGNPNDSWKFLNYIDTQSNITEFFFNSLKLDFAQSRLTLGDLTEGRQDANIASIRAAMMGYFSTLSGADFMLIQAGEESRVFFSTNLLITVDTLSGTATIDSDSLIVTQLRHIIGTTKIAFTREGLTTT